MSRGGRSGFIGVLCLLLLGGCQERQIRIHFEAAEKYRLAGDLPAAVAEYRAVVEMDSTQSDAQNNLGHLYEKLGQPDSALVRYRMALAVNPAFAEAHYNKGVLFVGQGLIDSAVASYASAIANDSTQAEAYNNLGVVYESSGKIRAAIDQYSLAVMHGSEFAPAHANLARASFLAGEMDQAIRSAHRTIELNPALIDGYVTLGTAYVEQNDFARSLQYLEAAARIAPNHALVRQNLHYVRALQAETISAKASGHMRAAHIVVRNRGLGDVLLQKIRAGEDFSLLAQTHSIDPSGRDGGDIGAFKPGDLMPEFENLVKGLSPGQVGGPIETPLGYHIVKRIY